MAATLKTTFLRHFILLLAMGIPALLHAQTTAEMEFYRSHQAIQRKGMTLLGGWAVSNIGVGLALRARSEGETRYFHEMNAMWNSVNAALAAGGLIGASLRKTPFIPVSWLQRRVERIYLFNAGLDLAYMGTGLYLLQDRPFSAQPQRMRGYGKSLLLQGGFLLAFDGGMYLLQRRHRITKGALLPGMLRLSAAPGVWQLTWTF